MSMKSLFLESTDSEVYKIMRWVISAIIFYIQIHLGSGIIKNIYIVHTAVILALIFHIIVPLLKIWMKPLEERTNIFKEHLWIFVTAILLICLFNNIYKFFLSGDQILYESYRYVVICVCCLFVMWEYRIIHEVIKDDTETYKKVAKIIFHIIGLIIIFWMTYNSYDYLFRDEKTVDLSDLQTPTSISIERRERPYYKDLKSAIRLEKTRITKNAMTEDEQIINKLIEQIKQKDLGNLRGITYIDYLLKSDVYPYYCIVFNYESSNESVGEIEEGFINSIYLLRDGKVIFVKYDFKTHKKFEFMTFISRDLTDEIIAHVK